MASTRDAGCTEVLPPWPQASASCQEFSVYLWSWRGFARLSQRGPSAECRSLLRALADVSALQSEVGLQSRAPTDFCSSDIFAPSVLSHVRGSDEGRLAKVLR